MDNFWRISTLLVLAFTTPLMAQPRGILEHQSLNKVKAHQNRKSRDDYHQVLKRKVQQLFIEAERNKLAQYFENIEIELVSEDSSSQNNKGSDYSLRNAGD